MYSLAHLMPATDTRRHLREALRSARREACTPQRCLSPETLALRLKRLMPWTQHVCSTSVRKSQLESSVSYSTRPETPGAALGGLLRRQSICRREQFQLFYDRASSSVKRANQIRLWFSTIAYLLLVLVRKRRLKGTHLATAEAHTLRVRLIKCAVQVSVSVRRIYLSFAESFPSKEVFRHALQT
jgi:hypothetical protein